MRPGDNLMLHLALDLAEPGDVLVVDGGGELTKALVGELMMLWAVRRGLTGFVIDGAVREIAAYRDARFPCFAHGISARGPYKDGPGEINAVASLGGLAVAPGNIIIADEDGVVAFSPHHLDLVVESARAKLAAEERDKANIAAGH
jgi:regulator of RNase E activity RraA